MGGVGIAFFVLLTIGVTLILDSLVRAIANWRTTPLTNPETWGESVDTPDPAPTLSKNGYDPHQPAEGSGFEFTGRASVSCFPLTALGWFGVFAIMLIRESFPTTPDLSPLANLALAGAIVVGMVAVHEGLHAIVAAAYGADVSFAFRLAGPATIYENTILSRRALILITAAPFLVITPVAVGLALSGNWVLMAIGVLVLLFHTGMAGGDLFQVMQWQSEPPGTKLYPSSEVGIISYHPVSADSSAQSVLSRVDEALARVTAPLKVP
jgi:Putative zincin peptidase